VARHLALVVFLILVVLVVWLRYVSDGGLGQHEAPGVVTPQSRPASVVDATERNLAEAAEEMLVARPKQILFGDLHVHTTFSFDAFMLSLPFQGGEGTHPPADACDFARFCSALDFWSINDHAESITPRHWDETVESVRACNAVAGDPTSPDTVAYLGWEWTQVGTTPETHYGHKNVVLRDLEDESIPARPIGALATRNRMVTANPFAGVGSGAFLHALGDPRMHSLARFFGERRDLEICPLGVPVRDLPGDCVEMVDTPDLLFAKLDDWGHESIVIPHGTTWGFYTPPGSDWAKQLEGAMHDPERQTLLEIYSGHGNSEQWSDYASVRFEEDGTATCLPPAANGFVPTCWRAGEIIRERCLAAGESETECDERAATARAHSAAAGAQAHLAVPGTRGAEWLDAGQCPDCDQPAFNYRPRGSAQYITALSRVDEDGTPRRFRFGFMASSDNHFARPGTGYKETIRPGFTESRGDVSRNAGPLRSAVAPPVEKPAARSRVFDPQNTDLTGFALMEMERQASFFLTGGLVAAHADGRDRDSIWQAFQRREVYGTSGPRILLWFDLLNAPDAPRGRTLPMGSEVVMDQSPIFQVRAVGSFAQAPGCPDYATNALGPERLEHVCRGECYNPTGERRPITHIDVIRIRPQSRPDEPLDALIEDPWKRIECDGDPVGCTATFTDPDFRRFGRDTVYYVRAHEAEAPGINAGNLRCERDAEGRCVSVDLCGTDAADACTAPHEPRAWSSPIFVGFSL
jgi:hypothetical protein